MGLYEKYVLPRLVDFVCGGKHFTKQRRKVVPHARGRVLEVGFGSGLNLPHYDERRIDRLWALEPSRSMWALGRRRAAEAAFDVEYLCADAEAIPLESGSADTVLVTYALCTIPQVETALSEIRRVLSGEGTLIFCEHGAAPDPSVRAWQDRVNPYWKAVGGGCHLNRDAPALLSAAGFRLENLESMYLPGWKVATFNTWGRAVIS